MMFKVKKHYTEKEILNKFKDKSVESRAKILDKALQFSINKGGSYVHCLAVAMGYYYSDDYNESTWVYGGK